MAQLAQTTERTERVRRAERTESALYLFALCCLSVGLVVGIGVMKMFGAR